MATYFVKDINKEYTDIISDYINNKHFTIFCNSMGGSQGEKASIHLMSPDRKSVLRVTLDRFSNWKENTEGVEINVREYSTNKLRWMNELSSNDILWENEGVVIYNKPFYKISNYKANYFGDLAEATAASKKHWERYNKKDYSPRFDTTTKDITSDKVIKTILPWVKRQYKCGSTLKKNISKVEKCIVTGKYARSYYRVHLANKILELSVK